jgi:hypothetical protein
MYAEHTSSAAASNVILQNKTKIVNVIPVLN